MYAPLLLGVSFRLVHAVVVLVADLHDLGAELYVGLVPVYLGYVRGEVFPGGAGLVAVPAGHVGVSLVHPVDVLPQVRRPTVALVAEVARVEAVGAATMTAELLVAFELEAVAILAD